jgi:hypothetical protein
MIRRALARWVWRNPDERVERRLKRSFWQRMLMKELARLYNPDSSPEFEGEIGYELVTSRGTADWTLAIGHGRARVRRGRAPKPGLRVHVRAVDLDRMLIGQITTREALLGGRMTVHGQYATAIRIGELFTPGAAADIPRDRAA